MGQCHNQQGMKDQNNLKRVLIMPINVELIKSSFKRNKLNILNIKMETGLKVVKIIFFLKLKS